MVAVWAHDPWLGSVSCFLWGVLWLHTDDSVARQHSGLTDQRGTGGSSP